MMKAKNQLNEAISLHQLDRTIKDILTYYQIPQSAKRLALNFKASEFYSERAGIQPIEIQLDRTNTKSEWIIRFIATFDFPTPEAQKLDIALYFNLHYQWFYQPDIERCDINQPEVISLLQSWIKAFIQHLSNNQFDKQSLAIIKKFD